jgi:hypothetical protein
MLGPFCVSTTSKDRFVPILPSMHRDTVDHSPDRPALAEEGTKTGSIVGGPVLGNGGANEDRSRCRAIGGRRPLMS